MNQKPYNKCFINLVCSVCTGESSWLRFFRTDLAPSSLGVRCTPSDHHCLTNENLKSGSNEDESRWELASESLHECFLNSHCSVKRAVRVAWELTRVFLLFSISLFLLVASPLLFLRILTLVKLLTVRVITPTVTCRWYVIIFSFFLHLHLLLLMDLEIACFCNSYDSRATLMTGQTSQSSHWLSPKFEPAQSWWECMRVDESWRSNESESCDSHPLSSSFDQAFRQLLSRTDLALG